MKQIAKETADKYGYIFKISENNLVFYDVQTLKGTKSMQIFNKTDLLHINLREKTSQKYKSVQVTYFDPKKKKTAAASVKNENVIKGDTLKITSRCSSKNDAILKAKAALSTADTSIDDYKTECEVKIWNCITDKSPLGSGTNQS